MKEQLRSEFQMRAAALAVASCLSLTPLIAEAASLGKINVLSGMGQLLRAEIEVSAARDELPGMAARLASREMAQQAGVDVQPALSDLRFSLEKRPNGTTVIKVSSGKPINEPFLDFFVELNWPTGRLVREYVFLLDPPEVAAKAAKSGARLVVPAESRPVFAETKPAVRPVEKAEPRTETKPVPAAQVESKKLVAGADRREVKAGDTLNKIASETKPADVTLEQMLVGLFRGNPDAFVGNNINRLKKGVILNIPDKDAAASIPQAEAKKVLKTQVADWNAYRQKMAAAVEKAPAKADAGAQATSGKIAAKVEDKAAPTEAAKDQVKVSRTETAAKGTAGKGKGPTEEDLIAKEKALKEANERLKLLEKNVVELQKLVEMKNQNLAELQKQAASAKLASEGKLAADGKKSAEEAKKAEEARKAQEAAQKALDAKKSAEDIKKAEEAKKAEELKKAAEEAKKAEELKTAEAAKRVEEAKKTEELKKLEEAKKAEEAKKLEEAKKAEEAAKLAAVKPAEPAKLEAPAKPAEPPKVLEAPPPVPKKPTPPAPEGSSFFGPATLLGGGGLLALILGYVFYKRRRSQAGGSVAAMSTMAVESSLGPNSVFRNTGGQSVDTGNTTPQSTDFSQTGPGTIDTDEVDPVAEADVYMAYGRDAQAEEILLEALQKDPQRTAIHAKLLEIYANRKSVRQFETLASELYSQTGGVGGEWEKVAAMGAKLDPANPLYSAGKVADAAAFDADATMVVTPDHLKSTVTMPGALAQMAEETTAARNLDLTVAPAPAELTSLDFDLGSTTEPGTVVVLTPEAASDDVPVSAFDPAVNIPQEDALDFDLGLSVPEKTPTTVAESAPVAESLDFDLGLSTDIEGAVSASEIAAAPEERAGVLDLSEQLAEPELRAIDESLEFDVKLTDSVYMGAPAVDIGSINLDLAAEIAEPAVVAPSVETAPIVAGDASDPRWDEVNTKLDLAKAYEEMGDLEGARELLQEVAGDGPPDLVDQAKVILERIGEQ